MTQNFWKTDKILLRAIEPKDAEVIFQWNQDSERARLLDFLWPPQSMVSAQTWVNQQALRKLENGEFHWMIENLAGEPVGSISTHQCNQGSGTFSYGLDVAEEHRGKGYAQAAIRLVLKYYFQELRYQKVTVFIHEDNPASVALHVKLGFRLEGRLRRMVYTRGQYLDMIYYGLTAEEFFSGGE